MANKKPEWEWLSFKHIIPKVTPDNYIKLQELMNTYDLKTKTDAFSYCLRTLAKYVETKGYGVIDNYKSPSKEDKSRLIKVSLKGVKLTQIAYAQVLVLADKQGIKPEDWVQKLIYKALEEVQ